MTLTSTGAAPTSVGNPTRYGAIHNAIVATLTAGECGATLTARGTAYAGSGILVALPDVGTTIDLAGADLYVISARTLRWLASAAATLTAPGASPARYVGAWRDGNTLHLDVVEAYSDAEEDRARAAGLARGELAIFHAGRRECITLIDGGHAL